MKRPNFLEGVVLALFMALLGSASSTLGFALGSVDMTIRLVVSTLTTVYLLYLLARCPRGVGRITTLAVWVLVASLILWLSPSLELFLLVHSFAVWATRSAFFQRGFMAVALDGLLIALGMLAGLAALHRTGSLSLSVWTFFLLQSLFTALPDEWSSRRRPPARTANAFEIAHLQAEAALRRLHSGRDAVP